MGNTNNIKFETSFLSKIDKCLLNWKKFTVIDMGNNIFSTSRYWKSNKRRIGVPNSNIPTPNNECITLVKKIIISIIEIISKIVMKKIGFYDFFVET